MGLMAENLSRATKRKRIVDNVSMSLEAGEICSLLGPSGSGKSSLLRLIMGLDRLDSGSIRLNGCAVAGDGLHLPADQRGASMVFQDFTLFPHLNVQENIEFGSKRADVDCSAIVEMLEIGHLTRRSIANLSGGEQQRVALARALASGPSILLLDEPFSNIDNMLKERLYKRVLEYLRNVGTTVILATHDHREAFFFSDGIFVMRDGRLIDSNSPEDVYQRPASLWVAEFFGSTNIMTEVDLAQMGNAMPKGHYLVRPEMLQIVKTGVSAVLESSGYFGFFRDLVFRTDSGRVLKLRTQEPVVATIGDTVHLTLRSDVVPHRLDDTEASV